MGQKENGEAGCPTSPLHTSLKERSSRSSAGRGPTQPGKDHEGLVKLRDPRSPPPSSGADRPCAWTFHNESPAAFSCQRSPSRRARIVPSDEFAGHSGNPSAAFATARSLSAPLRVMRPPRFVERNFLPRRANPQARFQRLSGGLAGKRELNRAHHKGEWRRHVDALGLAAPVVRTACILRSLTPLRPG